MDTTIVPTNGNKFALSERDLVRAHYLKMMLPYGDKLTDENALALDVYGKLHDLDPLNGECYYLVREYKNDRGEVTKREELGCYPGIKGKRKKSKDQLRATDPQAFYKTDYTQIAEPRVVGLDANDVLLVVKCELYDSISQGQYIVNFLKLSQAGLTKEDIEAMIGKPPRWIGYGVVTKKEAHYIKQSPLQLARKRAESDATTQRFDLPFADDLSAEDVAPEITETVDNGHDMPVLSIPEEVTEGEYTDPAPAKKEHKGEQQLMSELGFG